MSTATDNKQELIDWINELEDQAILENLKGIKKSSEGQDFWHDLPEKVKTAINQAKKEADEGKGIPHKQVMQEMDQRFFR